MPRIMRLYLELGDTGLGGDGGLWLKIEDCDSVWIEEPGSCFVYPAWHGSDGPRLRVSESPRLRSLHALITSGTSRHQQRERPGLWPHCERGCGRVLLFWGYFLFDDSHNTLIYKALSESFRYLHFPPARSELLILWIYIYERVKAFRIFSLNWYAHGMFSSSAWSSKVAPAPNS